MRHYVSAIIALGGLVLLIVGAIMNNSSGGGANIGAGFLIIFGLGLLLAGLFSGALKAIVPRSHRR